MFNHKFELKTSDIYNTVYIQLQQNKQTNDNRYFMVCQNWVTTSRSQSRARSHQKTRRNWARLDQTASEIFRILQLDEKLTKSVVHQLDRVVRVFTPKNWLTTRFNSTQLNSLVESDLLV